jgi:hypothetical protein
MNNKMTRNILKDNKGNTYRIETCKYSRDYKGQPKPILPEDMSGAIRIPDGPYNVSLVKLKYHQNHKYPGYNEPEEQIADEEGAGPLT